MIEPEGKHDDEGNWRPYAIVIDLVSIPSPGAVQTILRTAVEDKKDINRASILLHMSQSDFVRTAVIGAARRVLAEVAKHSTSTFRSPEVGLKAPKVR